MLTGFRLELAFGIGMLSSAVENANVFLLETL
jgi:hypothetical protein